VERSDRIITELMGYARLVEGKVEKLDVVEELERALQQVFPAAVKYETRIVRDFAAVLPPLLAQRSHFSLILVNLLQNAREALNGGGQIVVSAHVADGFTVRITIADDGPGIPPDKVDKVFDPYFSTKEKGSGLGLAIVKHNTELYGGTVRVESVLGKGTTFALQFPARTVVRLRR
jgi:signal transduction histidine kinase